MPVANNPDLPNLVDLAKSVGADGMPLRIIEHLTAKRPLLQYLPWREANQTNGHVISRRRALPSGIWKKVNQGIPNSKASQDQVLEACGMLAARTTIDEDMVEMNGGAAYRMSQEKAKSEGLYNDLENALFYENAKVNIERITGIIPRLDSLTGDWKDQVVNHASISGDAAAGADQASILFIKPGMDTVYGIVPKGTKAGLRYKDMGLVDTPDEEGNDFPAYVGVWKWRCGLCVEDARYVVRLCNIDTSALARTGKKLIVSMIEAAHRLQEMEGAIILAHRTIATYLHQQALDTSVNSTFTMQEVGGRKITHFLGMPIIQADKMRLTESVVA